MAARKPAKYRDSACNAVADRARQSIGCGVRPMMPFLVALQFLTRVPITLRSAPDAREIGASLAFYPVIGALLGLVLTILQTQLADASALLRAALILSTWVLLTGALHLDGLADSADAWVGGRDREHTLALMKDPHCGPAAVVSLVLVLLLKF